MEGLTFLASIWLSSTRGDKVLAKELELAQLNTDAWPLSILLRCSCKINCNFL